MSKKEVFIVPGTGSKLDSRESVIEKLDNDERFILAQHPTLEQDIVLTILSRPPESKERQIAVETLSRLRAVRDALQDENTPAWKAAALGMRYQDMVNIYRQPLVKSATGKAHRGTAPTRKADDELALVVLKVLRDHGLTWEQAQDELAAASADLDVIAGVEIDKRADGLGYLFRQRSDNGPDLEQSFALSTLRNKWAKAK